MPEPADDAAATPALAGASPEQRPTGDHTPWLPPGGPIELPGRGVTFARDSGPVAGRPDAPVLLLLHGWAVTADLNFFPVYRPLSERYRVIAIDHRGHGRGIRPANGIVSLAACAEDAAALLDVLGIDRAVVLGYSMGGALAQLLWHHHPERVHGLVLCSTARHFQSGPITDLWYRSYTPLARLAHVADGPASALVRRRIDRRVDGDDRAEWMRSELGRVSPSGLLSSMRSVGQFRSNRWIGAVDVPASVIVTTRDRTVPARNQHKLAAAIPGATVHEVAGPHDSIVTRSGAYVPELLAACAEVTATRPTDRV